MSAVRLLAIAVVSLSLSGCAFPDGTVGSRFDAIAAPVWEAGYQWTFNVVSASQQAGFQDGGIESGGDSDETVATFRVTNTTTSVDGEPVYVIHSDEHLDNPLFQGNFQAFTKDSLAVAAYGYDAAPDMVHGSGTDPCRIATPMQPVPEESRFPTARFPLDDGATVTGRMGFDEPLTFDYTMEVHGLVDVTVPAGTFKTVYVTVDLEPSPLFTDASSQEDFPEFNLRIRSEQWYSPEAKFFVKNVATASAESASASEGSYRFAYRSVMELEDYSLNAAPEEPAPPVSPPITEAVPVAYQPYQIVSDVAFPFNIAQGPVTARFALAPSDREDYARPIGTMDPLPEPGFDPKTHEVVWTIQDSGAEHWTRREVVGNVLELVIERGANYYLEAQIRPVSCGGSYLGYASGNVEAFWSAPFHFDGEVGTQRQVDLGTFPAEWGAFDGLVTWTRTPAVAGLNDGGMPVLHAPDGSSQMVGGNGESPFGPYPPGQWTLAWDTMGPTLGDDVDLVVTVRYAPAAFIMH